VIRFTGIVESDNRLDLLQFYTWNMTSNLDFLMNLITTAFSNGVKDGMDLMREDLSKGVKGVSSSDTLTH
jgi:hypothetical protein